MIVKIGNKIWNSSEEPIMFILSDEEKKHIQNMAPNNHLYCSFPEGSNLKKIKKFMTEPLK